MENNHTTLSRPRKIEKLHWHIQHWKSDLQFLEDEIIFVEQLLNSNIFESNKSGMSDKLEDFLKRLATFNDRKTKVRLLISKHENQLGTVMESTNDNVITDFHHRHDDLELEVLDCTDNFKSLKAEIFNFVSGILKNRKSNID